MTSITIPDSVTSIGNCVFVGCTGELTVNCNIPSASNYEYGAFYGSKFTSVTIGDSVTTIGEYAFYSCSSLTSVTIGDSVTTIGDEAFYRCSSLTSVYISDSSAWCKIDFGNYSANPLYYATNLYLNNELATDLVIPSDITEIKSYAFINCSSLTRVTIPDSVTTIGGCAFSGCSSLTSVTIPDGVTSIGNSAFDGCSSLTSITIPDSVTEIGACVFSSCSSLREFNGKYASEDGRCLIIDGTLNSFAPAGLTEYTIPDSVTTIGYRAFYYCSSLTSVTIPDSVTTIGSSAFCWCESLTSVYCKAVTPPTVESYDGYLYPFDANVSNLKIYVPKGSVEAYKSASGWGGYYNYSIVGYDF